MFQGRLLRFQYEAALARWEQAKVTYEQNVDQRLQRGLDGARGLPEVRRGGDGADAGGEGLQQAVSLSNTRYGAGLSDYLEVLQAQQQLFPAEILLAQARYNRLATLVQLYQGAGGGWQPADRQGRGASPGPRPATGSKP